MLREGEREIAAVDVAGKRMVEAEREAVGLVRKSEDREEYNLSTLASPLSSFLIEFSVDLILFYSFFCLNQELRSDAGVRVEGFRFQFRSRAMNT